eukprot:TRINITY_DN88989_c0_g1_i1.p1 TRINITY_DN88989_c0_g1~~TRINITY_DN88989_c0_g1_i1.p1  ORF type:complete len:908 (+),score=202.65 TRINITY_DN88989_c0_g1_i1:132-2855(+)
MNFHDVVRDQQRQIDRMTEKVARVVSDMHADLLQDVRRTTEDIQQRDRVCFDDLQNAEGNLRIWVKQQFQESWCFLEEKLCGVRDDLASEMIKTRACIVSEMEDVQTRVAGLEGTIYEEVAAVRRRNQETDMRWNTQFASQIAQLQSSRHELMGQLRRELESHVARCVEANRASQESSFQRFSDSVHRNTQNSKRELIGELSREVEVQVAKSIEAHIVSQQSSFLHFADSLNQSIYRTVEHPAPAKDALDQVKKELRQEAETRLDAKMATTHGMAQRLINELRQDLEQQGVQLNLSLQAMADALQQQVHLQLVDAQKSIWKDVHSEMQQGFDDISKEFEGQQTLSPEFLLEVTKQLRCDVNAQVAEQLRCGMDALEPRLKTSMQQIAREEVERDLHGRQGDSDAKGKAVAMAHDLQERFRQDLESQESRMNSSLQQTARHEFSECLNPVAQDVYGDATVNDLPRAVEMKVERLASKMRTELEQPLKHLMTNTDAAEQPLVAWPQDFAAEQDAIRVIRCDMNAQEAKWKGAMQQLLDQSHCRKEGDIFPAREKADVTEKQAEFSQELEGPVSGIQASLQQFAQTELAKHLKNVARQLSGDEDVTDLPRAIEMQVHRFIEILQKRHEQQLNQQETRADDTEQPQTVQVRALDSSQAAISELRRDLEAQESRLITLLPQIAREELLQEFKDTAQQITVGNLCDAVRSELQSSWDQLAEELRRDFKELGLQVQSSKEDTLVSKDFAVEAEKHSTACKAAEDSCISAVDKIAEQESQLSMLASQLHARIVRDGHRLLGQIGFASRKAAGTATTKTDTASVPAGELTPGAVAELCPEGDFLADLERRVNKQEDLVGKLQQLLLAMRDQMMGGGSPDESARSPSERSSRSRSHSRGTPSERSRHNCGDSPRSEI